VAGVELYYDVTDRKRSERSLRHERNLIEQIFETVPAGVGVLSTTGEIIRANERAEELLGVTENVPDEGRRAPNLRRCGRPDFPGRAAV